ncbi:PREDICTED: probable disease resistance protein At1g15890 [Camelina sativa]|uniref:Probable disease resistance protein At1g15890 n=1 Tax=Camelina sativa TaxID=90675 RepID=A0ABM1QBM4_CAMSA|nr:PREDICTED: probable disease resistance protein At1g15890 [Camelina sativa]
MGNCLAFEISCDQVLNHACGCLFGDQNYILMMEGNLEALENTMQELEAKRDDLLRRVVLEEDKGLQRLAQVQGWFSRVETVGSQVNDLLEARSAQTRRLCLCGYCSKNLISGCDYGKKLAKKLNEVQGLLSKGIFELVAAKGPAPKVEEKHIQTTVGLDTIVESTWNHLMSDGRRSLGLYGMGGVGKTTLLTRTNNKFLQLMSGFDIVIWVVVSKDLQNEVIQEQILVRLGLDKECKQKTEKERAAYIYNNLNRKKFVLLLDDLWSKVDLNKIGVPPPTQENGSKILLTTRSIEVCKDMEVDETMEVKCLSPDDAWDLFQKIVGDQTLLKSHQEITALARKVVEKCCGLPLALNVIGKAMTCKDTIQEWEHAIHVLNSSSLRFPGIEVNLFSVLKFSYDSLKDEKVKSCFLYCCLFPEDFQIEKEELIEYWICEGFIYGNGDEDVAANYYQGHDIIGTLLRAHLLMHGDFSNNVKMHDVIREIALWIASDFGKQKETLCVKTGVQLRHVPNDINWKVMRRMSLVSNKIVEISCRSFNCPNLSTLLLQKNKLVNISGEFFRFMPALVVLDLSENESLSCLPEEISNLGSLQYLNLSSTMIKWLPVGLKELTKLINLNLEYTNQLQSLVGISTILPNLQVLKLLCSRVCVDDRLIEELQLLNQLKISTVTVDDARILESIQEVKQLSSTIRGLCLNNMSAHVVRLNTVALGGLHRFIILDFKISEIKIDCCKSKESNAGISPMCTSSQGFKHLSIVQTFELEGPMDFTWLLFAQNLTYLSVRESLSIEEIINREKAISITNVHPDIVVPFGKLETLDVSLIAELKGICWNLPALRTTLKNFTTIDCPKLSLSY